MKIIVTFVGIDQKNRPVFKSSQGYYYGSVEKLFAEQATRQEVLAKVTDADLTYFGRSFGCEPQGVPVAGVQINREA